jgi:sensor histidine kinase YesM
MLAKLSELLRMSLDDEGAQEVSLRSELEFIGRYLELERMRFNDRLHGKPGDRVRSVGRTRAKANPATSFRNAIRHGIAPLSTGGQISIEAFVNRDRLHLRVTDNGPGLSEPNAARRRAGVGLSNTRARLAELYGTVSTTRAQKGDKGGLMVEIRIPVPRF